MPNSTTRDVVADYNFIFAIYGAKHESDFVFEGIPVGSLTPDKYYLFTRFNIGVLCGADSNSLRRDIEVCAGPYNGFLCRHSPFVEGRINRVVYLYVGPRLKIITGCLTKILNDDLCPDFSVSAV